MSWPRFCTPASIACGSPPQGTGHNAGPLGSLENTLLLKTERMRGVHIDANARLARVEAGSVWLEVVEAAARHGLAALAGSSPDVGVVGYTLGGGMSFLSRKYGLCANAVRAIELVTADGRLVRADRDNEPDLFWALRGGGGSFGVVTAIELELFPIEHAYAGVLFYPIERGSEVLHAWRELTQSDALPDELTTVARFLRLPPIPDIPEELRGKSFVTVDAYHLGDPGQADELLAPLRALGPINDTIATVPVPALSHLHMDPEQPVPAAGDGLMIAELPARAVDAFVEVAGQNAKFPLVTVELRHLEGALRTPARLARSALFDRGPVRAVRSWDGADPGARGTRARPGARREDGDGAVGGVAHVPELRRDATRPGEILDRARLPPPSTDQVAPSTPRRHPLEPPDPGRPLRELHRATKGQSMQLKSAHRLSRRRRDLGRRRVSRFSHRRAFAR